MNAAWAVGDIQPIFYRYQCRRVPNNSRPVVNDNQI